MTTFRCPSDILITSWLFTARWSTWPGNHLVPCVAELVGSCIPIHARRCLPKCLFYPSYPALMLERQAGSLVWGLRNTRKKWTLSQLVHRPEPPGKGEQCNSQISHHRPCRGREPCHRLEQDKSGRQRGTATDQMDKRGTLVQEDTVVHESGRRILPTEPHMGPGDFQVTCSIQL